MFSKFLNLESEKQDRIINAAINEFSEKGYRNASTNEIVKNAGISKGLLFHYFKNKKSLYLFLFDYFLEIIQEEIYSKMDYSQRDLFKIMRQASELKFEIYRKYPKNYNFMFGATIETDEEVRNELERRETEAVSEGMRQLLSNIDKSKFKEGVDPDRAVNIITWAFEGFANSILANERGSMDEQRYAELYDEAMRYLELLEKCLYK